ncbi:hypothetical protein [Deinococcus multiflagellatus]|uniref:hypothetical protein n=1 Tax=Deinococcus multiflagellatus TaxID=1656887 RepID=UPI001CCE522D|nr:hypothetical protein [Deinococcus multiflagellatus]MBZ9715371.1 hypothetical protein [Deinococcus multiflagellatus]
MNEALMTALGEAKTAATEAKTAAEAGNFKEARTLLEIMEERLEEGKGGNAAHAARRRAILKLEAEVRAILDAADEAPQPETDAPAPLPLPTPEVTLPLPPVAELQTEALPASGAERQDYVPEDLGQDRHDYVPAPAVPEEGYQGDDAGRDRQDYEPAPVAQEGPKVRGVAAPHSLTAEEWARVADALRAQGVTVEARQGDATRHEAAYKAATEARDTWRAKVEERFFRQAQLDVAALTGDVAAANAAWDRLFDVVTAIRSREGAARRKGRPEAATMKPVYEAARDESLQIRRWARGVQAA